LGRLFNLSAKATARRTTRNSAGHEGTGQARKGQKGLETYPACRRQTYTRPSQYEQAPIASHNRSGRAH
jgi:hypothetical protein